MIKKKPIIAITLGDPNGIGIEIVLKGLKKLYPYPFIPLLIGQSNALNYYKRKYSINIDIHIIDSISQINFLKHTVWCIEPINRVPYSVKPGYMDSESGLCAMQSLKMAVQFINEKQIDALVTAPISKKAICMAGYSNFTGHTDFLKVETSSSHVLMLMVTKKLILSLQTAHIPLSKVSTYINKENLKQTFMTLKNSLLVDFSMKYTRIAMLGLNPHAGEDGELGTEERDILIPFIQTYSKDDVIIEGPFSSDTFFAMKRYQDYSVVWALYHDQGLIPFKMMYFDSGVNFTAGLPIPRTSPIHGTAFDIAGNNKAIPFSFIAAVNKAYELAMNRLKNNP